ncbi:DUF1517 domain-containing protein [Kovacikia minuta CCNUW1]|uniref:DUF1517 domain-containing protein n=1 Tax=Kovacikia minuta TaxID=2931930 RepID=UPI001CCB57D8|nr:DUF1517 domain-containing protein [Kovacikia minuta]UBF25726.1 DUF1517 domain-containing protein [Kovacikia minuta CCNUW1]
MERSRHKRFGALAKICAGVVIGILWSNSFGLRLITDATGPDLKFDTQAYARSSGGRAGGGSFRSSPSRSGSSGSPSGGSYSRSNPSWDYQPYPSSPSYSRPSYRGPVIVPVPAGPPIYVPSGPPAYSDPYYTEPRRYPNATGSNRSTDDGGWGIVALLLIGLSVPVVLMLVFSSLRARQGGGGIGGGGGGTELANDTVTVSKVQVALLAQARSTQAELNQLSQTIDTSTPEGLLQLLQEAVLALLRTPENWSHVRGSSETVRNLTEAEAMFNKLSIAERSKFSVETLTNVGGRINRQTFKPDSDQDPASYIVVTLLIGTAHDKPLFSEIHTVEELKDVLEKLASVPADYLMVFELLWSPQDEADHLTYDELLTEYSDMVQL